MNIREKIEMAEKLWKNGDDWEAEDYHGAAYLDIKEVLKNIKINDDMSFLDIIDDLQIDEYTLILKIKEDIQIIDIDFDTLFELSEKLDGNMELSYMKGMMFIYKHF